MAILDEDEWEETQTVTIPLHPVRYGIEVLSPGKRWIKFRIGGARGPQATFPTEKDADNWLRNSGMARDYYRVRRLAIAALGLIALGGVAHAQSYADDVCHELRAQRPALVAPIAVLGHQPVTVHGKLTDRRSYWKCPALTASGMNLRPVDAETYVPANVRNVFQCEGVSPEDGCLVRDGTSIGTHYKAE